jgi:hypothetical protein
MRAATAAQATSCGQGYVCWKSRRRNWPLYGLPSSRASKAAHPPHSISRRSSRASGRVTPRPNDRAPDAVSACRGRPGRNLDVYGKALGHGPSGSIHTANLAGSRNARSEPIRRTSLSGRTSRLLQISHWFSPFILSHSGWRGRYRAHFTRKYGF